MKSVVKFNVERDIQEVDQFGFVDLTKSISEGFVPSDIGISAESFDGEDLDPESLIGKPSDVFEAMRIQDSLAQGINNRSKKVVDKSSKKDVDKPSKKDTENS